MRHSPTLVCPKGDSRLRDTSRPFLQMPFPADLVRRPTSLATSAAAISSPVIAAPLASAAPGTSTASAAIRVHLRGSVTLSLPALPPMRARSLTRTQGRADDPPLFPAPRWSPSGSQPPSSASGFEIEAHACDAMADLGVIPRGKRRRRLEGQGRGIRRGPHRRDRGGDQA